MITEKDVLDSLGLLGDTSDQIAESLYNKGCFARYCETDSTLTRDAESNCPLAVYLGEQFDFRYININNVAIDYIEDPVDGYTTVITPQPLEHFILDFDKGLHPQLFKQE